MGAKGKRQMLKSRLNFANLALVTVVVAGSLPAVAQQGGKPPESGVGKVDAEAAKPAEVGADDPAVRMRGLEERVMLLRETVLSGSIAGAKASLVHQNLMGSNFVLESASYSLDGAPVFNKVDSEGDLADRERIELFTGSIVPGNHNISVNLVYRGSGFGLFSYLKGYKFKIKSSYAFTAEEGKVTTVRVVMYEKGGITTDLQDRPAIRYDVDVKVESGDAPAPAAAPAAQ